MKIPNRIGAKGSRKVDVAMVLSPDINRRECREAKPADRPALSGRPGPTHCYVLTTLVGIEGQKLRSSVALGGAVLRNATRLLFVNPLWR